MKVIACVLFTVSLNIVKMETKISEEPWIEYTHAVLSKNVAAK